MAAINKEKASMILGRIVAVFAASGLSVIGAGAIAGVELSQAVLMAGIGGVATVVEGLSRAYLQDGKLSTAEIDEVFNAVDKKNSARKAASSSK
jgi:ActR/RegA family two-component response regulator